MQSKISHIQFNVQAANLPFYKDLQKLPMWDDPFNKTLISQLPDVVAVGYPGPTTLWALEAWRTHTVVSRVSRACFIGASSSDLSSTIT